MRLARGTRRCSCGWPRSVGITPERPALDVKLSAADAALVSTIYNPPRARQPWRLNDVLPDSETRFYSLARWALVDALRACGVGSGDHVLVPGLICRELLASISLLGATAGFYPVSRQLSAEFSADGLSQAKAVIAVNYFGFPQDLKSFRSYCRRTGAALIEDNAHGLLSRDEDGKLLGSRADAGLFSFRKTIAVPDGGALVLGGERSMPPAADVPAVKGGGSRYRLKQAMRPFAGPLGPVRTLKTIRAGRLLRRLLTGEAVPHSPSDAETRIPMPSNPRALIGRGIGVADPEPEAWRRRTLYELAGRIVDQCGGVPVFPSRPANVVPYGFPIFATPAQASGIAAGVGRYGLQLSQWPDLPTAVAASAPDHYRHLMVLPFLW